MGIVLAVVVPAAPAVASADTTPLSSSHRAVSTAVSAHRALDGSGGAENSLASFQRAARSGETDIEGDVRATKDGSFVMSHDASLRTPRCAGPYLDVPLRALTLAQVGKMTCSGEPVARLADVIDVVRPYPAAILRVEVKHAGTDTSTMRTSDAVRLAKTLAGAGMTARSIVQDFDWATTTRAVRTASPTQRVSALAGTLTVATVASARSLGAYDLSYAQGASTGFWNRLIAANGLRSTVWTVDDPTRARVLRAEGVRTVISNVPSTVRAALGAPASECRLTTYPAATPTRGVTLAPGARTSATLPQRSPDGRVVETALVRVTASTSSGAAALRVAPQGTPLTTTWEQTITVDSTSRSTVIEVALGDRGAIRIRNTSTRAVSLAMRLVGGRAYTCS